MLSMTLHYPFTIVYLLYIADVEGVGAGAQCQTHDGEEKLSGTHVCDVYMANGNDSRSKLYAYMYIGIGCFLTTVEPL